jgi:hypothetical protein
VDTGEGWQWSVMSYLGLASLPVVILAIALSYKTLRIGVALSAFISGCSRLRSPSRAKCRIGAMRS